MAPFVGEHGFWEKPVIIHSVRGAEEITLKTFVQAFQDHRCNALVDVQGFSATGKRVIATTTNDVLQRITQGSDLNQAAGKLPMNLLDLRSIRASTALPRFLNHRRFNTIPVINSRLEMERYNSAGKRSLAATQVGREVDLTVSTNLCLFGQRGAFSGFLVDNPGGTWMRNGFDRKVCIFPATFDDDGASRAKFATNGDDWVPKALRCVILEPGDTPIMGSGHDHPHAVLTMEDSHMVGGMYIDRLRVVETIQQLIWVAQHLEVTNEAIPRQLLARRGVLKDIAFEVQHSTAADDFEELSPRSIGELFLRGVPYPVPMPQVIHPTLSLHQVVSRRHPTGQETKM
ncbi:LOW QUALITY PROTEIN: hypothetical protein ColTof4_14390 [Colletotrichum tofieldiae]|nr:LOW QUALITY PROTEIN: hypothetical protein ColTof3_14804 [Colletotrichum tofieldiae]GKT81967.1 LOW QUALITY PROTEIN: hypothetical protein ColTof4_14390 [Colletotrichum tofieldiae]